MCLSVADEANIYCQAKEKVKQEDMKEGGTSPSKIESELTFVEILNFSHMMLLKTENLTFDKAQEVSLLQCILSYSSFSAFCLSLSQCKLSKQLTLQNRLHSGYSVQIVHTCTTCQDSCILLQLQSGNIFRLFSSLD